MVQARDDSQNEKWPQQSQKVNPRSVQGTKRELIECTFQPQKERNEKRGRRPSGGSSKIDGMCRHPPSRDCTELGRNVTELPNFSQLKDDS